MLPNDALLQELLHLQQLFLLALEHLRDGDAGPLRDDFGDFLLRHFVPRQLRTVAICIHGLRQPSLELGDLAVLQLGHAAKIGRASRLLDLGARSLELFLDVHFALHGCLLGLPHLFEVGVLGAELFDLAFEISKPSLRGVVALLLQGLALDLELNQPALEAVHLLGLAVHLHANA